MCFYCTQSDILLCGTARFSRGNKNKLRPFQLQKGKKLRTANLKQSLLVLINKQSVDDSNRSTSKTLSHKVSRNCNISKDIIYDNVITECNNDLNISVSENFRPFKCLTKGHVRSRIITAT